MKTRSPSNKLAANDTDAERRTRRPRSGRTCAAPSTTTGAWMNVAQAAAFLGIPAVTLRRTIERSAQRGEDGSTVTQTDGITARKLGRVWRVWLDASWRSPMSGR